MESVKSLFLTSEMTKVWTEGVKILAATLLLALASQISFFLPFTPVHVTMQTAALFFIGASLGSKRSVLVVLLYLAEGAMGMPVFASGKFGLATLLGPSGGYYIGFIPAVAIAGTLYRKQRSFLSLFSIFALSNATIYLFGLPWLALYVGFEPLLSLGLYPFLVGDLLKISAISAGMKGLKQVLSRC